MIRLFFAASLMLLSFYSFAQDNKLIRKLNGAEFISLKQTFSDYEKLLLLNLNDTTYEVRRNFTMSFTPSHLYKSNIKVWDEKKDSAQFVPIFDYVKYDKASPIKNYRAKFLLNVASQPNVYYDQLRKYYFFTIPVKKMETWVEIIPSVDTLINRSVPDSLQAFSDSLLSSNSPLVKIDTVLTNTFDTIPQKKIVDNVFYFRTSYDKKAFSGFKIYSISIPRKNPEPEPLSKEMQWWVALPQEWKKYFMEKLKIDAYPEFYQIRNVQGLRELDISNQKISDISFLSNFHLLEKLSLKNTQVADLSPIKGLTSLIELDISGTKVDTLLYLRNLTRLEKLDVSGLKIVSLEDIAGLTNLIDLTCHENKLVDLSPLKNLSVLKALDISLNYDIKDITPITEIVSLEKLILTKIKIKSLEPLTKLQNLVYLDVFNSGISDLSPIKRLPKLMYLELSHNAIEDVSPLRSLNYIVHLGLASTKVYDLSPLKSFRNLEYLNIAGNPNLKDISAVPNETLNTFICNYTGVSSNAVQRFKKRNPKCKITYY